ncbi:hypothetical protein L3N51_02177 [Metallosphaera sp. J1]|uniref:hypothetical protein n=1 Tax=Metallosphaera TaxID=41980 RepID=UPI001EDF1AA4|nr:hypothetical protein [Metallosphaera javensis (ex Hofmann et al. 2022)]MCG3109880.1 hypothetical protein [Metallosphaera javensis (ex Hofmann et al. 2022)]BCS92136.1 MAG: hypothetical protein MjAS7_0744 [Metallosphaera javensis (ex Sakai et al. 2022)]
MKTIRVIFGINGDQGVIPMIYQVIRSFQVQNLRVEVSMDLLYDLMYPTIEYDGIRTTLDYLSDDEMREQIMKLIRGEISIQRSPKLPVFKDDKVISDGVFAS